MRKGKSSVRSGCLWDTLKRNEVGGIHRLKEAFHPRVSLRQSRAAGNESEGIFLY